MLQDNFQVLAPPGGGGAYIWRGDFTEGFLRYEFGGVYIWRGLYMDELIFGILRYATTISDLITFRGRNGLAKWCGRSRCRFKLKLTWDQALFSFLFLNKIPAGKPKRKESLIQTFHETSSAQLFWLIDFFQISQSKLLPVIGFLVCKFFIRGKNAVSLT